jgi:hypothetical protein
MKAFVADRISLFSGGFFRVVRLFGRKAGGDGLLEMNAPSRISETRAAESITCVLLEVSASSMREMSETSETNMVKSLRVVSSAARRPAIDENQWWRRCLTASSSTLRSWADVA